MSAAATPTPLIPPSFHFRLALPCRRVDGIPQAGKGRLLNLGADCAIPSVAEVDGKEDWAEVRAAWNPGGIGLAVEVSGKVGKIQHVPDRPEESDGVTFWIDTRDTRDIHRASRHCHRFLAAPVPGAGKGIDVAVRQLKIARSTADAPMADPALIRSAAERTRTGYRLELFLPSMALNGFDPETNRRLGFYFRATDPDRGDASLVLGREFPSGEDPSLWATLELIESPTR